MKKITVAAILVFALIGTTASAAQRRRSTRPPHPLTPAEWLAAHAYRGVDAIGTVVGLATTIGLGDDTHGTHEFFATKLSMIQKLVIEDGVTLVGFEATFPDFTKLDDYVLGADVDPRPILQHHELGYWFWAADEIVTTLDWIRSYNMTRGDRPLVEVVGFDVWDVQGAEGMVTSYLDTVDPAAAAKARSAFSACPTYSRPPDCVAGLQAVADDVAARETDFVSRSSQHAYDRALHAAHIVTVGLNVSPISFAFRDQNMAANAITLKQRMAPNARMVIWAHNEHVGKTIDVQSVKPMGQWLAEQLGADYFAVGSSSANGSFRVIRPMEMTAIADLPALTSNSYESFFQSAAIPLMIIPLRGALPDWLSSPHDLHGGTTNFAYDKLETLPEKFDAILYFDHTTPSTSFW